MRRSFSARDHDHQIVATSGRSSARKDSKPANEDGGLWDGVSESTGDFRVALRACRVRCFLGGLKPGKTCLVVTQRRTSDVPSIYCPTISSPSHKCPFWSVAARFPRWPRQPFPRSDLADTCSQPCLVKCNVIFY